MNNKIDLSEYTIKNGIRLYNFCDVLLEKNVSNKSKFLEKHGIYYNSFKQEKRLGNASQNNKTVSKLLEIFNYNFVAYELEKIENILQDILNQAFFKSNESYDEHLDFLNSYIEKNDCLQPVYILFKVILIAFGDLKYNNSLKELEDELIYLQPFVKKKYFYGDLDFLLKCMLFYFNIYKNEIELDSLSNIYSKYIWIYYEIRAGKGFIDKNYPIMQMNYEKALVLYEQNYNFKRVLLISNNFCFYYNKIGQYLFSLKYSTKLISNAYIKELEFLYSYVIMHHFVSLFMLYEYKKIINTYISLVKKNAKINAIAYAIYVLSELIDNNASIDNFSTPNKYIEWIKEYINNRNKKTILSYAKNEYEEIIAAMIVSKIK